MERASWRRRDRAGNFAADRRSSAADLLQIGNRIKQQARVGMARRAKDGLRRTLLDNAPEIHHAQSVGHVPHHRQIVADEQIGQTQAALQIPHQGQNLCMNRNVKRTGRFVAHQEIRFAGEARAMEIR